ncbi:MAG: hypothetical protein ACRDA8_17145 [Shewanella sp.]
MRSVDVKRTTALWSGIFVNVFVWGIWWLLTKEALVSYNNITSSSDLVSINVYGLGVPVGALGIGFFTIASPSVAFFTRKRSDHVWGKLGSKIANYMVGIFALLGILTAIVAYQWMTNRLESQGYLYCKPLSRISAMGRHEVYVASPELCVKPGKTP